MPKIISYFVALIIMTSCASPIYANQSVADFSILFGPDNSKKLVVFVHGFDSDPTRAWTNGEGVSWPDLIKDDDKFSGYTVAMYRYDSPFFTRTSTIEEIATRMLRQIEDKGIFEKYSEIYFITHSMGGLVVKRVLVELHRPTQIDKLRKVKAVLFIATPAQARISPTSHPTFPSTLS
jgi:triacylglycerol esterase/lipase EstA (alpha/beta hydrolase family)